MNMLCWFLIVSMDEKARLRVVPKKTLFFHATGWGGV
jgi:hypothetical protein